MSRLTVSQTKYLHAIYKAHKDKAGIRSVDISRELRVTKASVSRMMRLLAELGLITVETYGAINLTQEGNREGKIIDCKMERLFPFFAEYLELDEPEAIDSAYFFMSGFSEHCVERLLGKGWLISQT